MQTEKDEKTMPTEKDEKTIQKDTKIHRFPDSNAGWFGGVCAGIAYKFKIQAWIPRLVWTLSSLLLGFGILPYILCWIFIPKSKTPEDYENVCR